MNSAKVLWQLARFRPWQYIVVFALHLLNRLLMLVPGLLVQAFFNALTAHKHVNLNLWLLHLAHLFAWVRVEGLEHLDGLKGPVLFASNHQSFFDTPSIFIAMPWKWRHRLAPTMRKEFFDAHFHPREHGLASVLPRSLEPSGARLAVRRPINYWGGIL